MLLKPTFAKKHAGTLSDAQDNKMLASFVPALLLKELAKDANLQMPSSQQYEAVALFAVRLSTTMCVHHVR